ncbi:MAG: hypothetical protein AAF579_17900 [Cyanobacteria bacterium P01_C01_bin.118]
MTLQNKNWIAGLLGFSGIALSTLVPGGPIETRSFAHINPFTLGVFNTFLTTLCLGSLVLVYFVLRAKHWAVIAAAVCGLSYLGVYGLDLAQIFPVSPNAMPPALLVIEVVGTLVSFPLMGLSLQAMQKRQTSAGVPQLQTKNLSSFQLPQVVTAAGLGIMGLGIITFATRSAMGL